LQSKKNTLARTQFHQCHSSFLKYTPQSLQPASHLSFHPSIDKYGGKHGKYLITKIQVNNLIGQVELDSSIADLFSSIYFFVTLDAYRNYAMSCKHQWSVYRLCMIS